MDRKNKKLIKMCTGNSGENSFWINKRRLVLILLCCLLPISLEVSATSLEISPRKSEPPDGEERRGKTGWNPFYRDSTYVSPKDSIFKPDAKSLDWLKLRIGEIEDSKTQFKKSLQLQSIKSGIEAISDYNKSKSKWSGEAKLGLSDESTTRQQGDDFRLGAEVDLGTNTYPNETRLKFKFEVEEDDNGLEESVSTILISHDRYFKVNWGLLFKPEWKLRSFLERSASGEFFIFAERFTSDEMLVDQRWEIGLGTKFEFHLDSDKVFVNKKRRSIVSLYAKKDRYDPFEYEYWKPNSGDSVNESVSKYLAETYEHSKVSGRYTDSFVKK